MKLKLLREILMFSKYAVYGLILQTLFLNIIIARDTNAQKIESIKKIYVELTDSDLLLKSILLEIEKKSELIFSYDEKELRRKLNRLVSLDDRTGTVAEILTDISKKENLRFKQVNRNVSVKKVSNTGDNHANPVEIQINAVSVSGKVQDESGEPLPGVNVLVKGTSVGTVTDLEGTYQLDVPDENATLVFSFIGYNSVEIVVGQQSVINVTMQVNVQALEEVIVVGYGTVRKSDLTGSVASIKGDAVKEFPVTSVDQALQARAPGVLVKQTSSAPGGGVSVRIRGSNSINSGSEPLYVIDGFPIYPDNTAFGTTRNASTGGVGNRSPGNSMASLNPNDIESIEILKDASATAIYGSRGSNGVVLITTKRGKSGKAQIDYDGSMSVQTISNRVDRLNAREYAVYRNLLETNRGADPVFSDAEVAALGEGTDWYDEILQTGSISNHQLTFSGGSEKTRYALTGNYHQNEGIVKGSDFERFGIRLNLDNDLLDDFITINSSWSFNRSISSNMATDRQTPGDGGITISALGLDPTVPVRDENGNFNLVSYDGRFDINPVQEARFVDDQDFTNRFFGNSGFTFKITDDLKFKTSIGADVINANRVTFFGPEDTFLGRQRNGDLQNFSRYSTSILNENILSYSKRFGDHFIDAVAGYTYQQEVNRFTSVSTRGFIGNSSESVNLQDGTSLQIPTSGREEWNLKSILARANYTFKDRYLVTFTFRRDGSSKFGGSNKWANFPSLALGWRIVEEGFYQNSGISTILTDLKIRASYGITGNSQIPVFNSLAGLEAVNYLFGGQLVAGLVDSRLPNEDLKWESTKMFNVGLDFGIMEDRLTFTADYFFNRTDDLLLRISIPNSTGFTSVLKNSGSLENKGFELSFNYAALNTTNLTWDISGNISILRNEITDLGSSTPFFAEMTNSHLGVTGSWVEAGNPIGVWRGYKFTGLFQSQEEVDNNPSLPGDKAGYPRYQDTDGDGEISPDDFVILGDPNPDFTWGLNTSLKFRNFDFALFFRGVHGNDVRNLQASELGDGVQRINQIAGIVENSWRPDNTNASRPIIDAGRDFANSFRDSDFFIEDGSFIRLQNVAIGYTLPEIKHIRRARVYVSAQNPFVITDYSGFDPEVNNQGQNNLNRADDYDAYPRARVFTLGLNLGF